MTGEHPWAARKSGRPGQKALARLEQEARAARRREGGGRGRQVTVEVARLAGPDARPSAGAKPVAGAKRGKPSRWASVEQAWRDEMRRLDEPEPATD